VVDDKLAPYRETINRIDQQLVQLLNERAQAAQAIGAAKADAGAAVFVPHREKAVFDRVTTANQGPLKDETLVAIWREIMSGTLALEHPMRICHLGRPGSFTQQAAMLKFGQSVAYHAVEAIPTVFNEVERGHADYGIVPIENSSDGGITDTIDAFLATSLVIVNELHLQIRHHLMGHGEQDAIERVYSKDTAFGQCRQWLSNNLPNAELIECSSTTVGAERAAADPAGAAIGNATAASHFGLNLVAEDIQDLAVNTTRFVVLAKPDRAAQPSGDDRTSIMFGVQDRAGALYDCLLPLHRRGISLNRIESRPSKRQAWEYLFFIDLVGHHTDPEVAAALDELRTITEVFQILGSYPRARQSLNA
jgi:chorismate mutase/prephenate dehydratase